MTRIKVSILKIPYLSATSVMINFSGDDDGNSNNGNNYKMMENYETCSSSNLFSETFEMRVYPQFVKTSFYSVILWTHCRFEHKIEFCCCCC